MPLDAVELGFDKTMQILRQLLADRFGLNGAKESVQPENSLFSLGLGLSSLDGIEFLCEVEKQFGVRVDDLEWWVYETPTLGNVTQHIIELSRRQHSAPN